MTADDQLLRLRERLSRLRSMSLLGGASLSSDLKRLQKQIEQLEAAPTLTGEQIWHSVELARHERRPYTLDYVERLLGDWFELHGDRALGDDGAMIAGLGRLDDRTVVLVGQQKGRDAGQAKKAAAAFKPDAIHCLELGVVDEIVPEPVGGAHIDPDMAARLLGQALRQSLAELEAIPGDDLRRRRRARFRALGVFA